VDAAAGEQGQIIIYNSLGAQVREITLHEGINDVVVNTLDYKSGIYSFVLRINEATIASNKIIKL
jgi:hypothetical protein